MAISPNSRSRPRYAQAETALRTLLETGGYRPGDKLPPEPELARQLGVSRATLREVLRSYEQQGLITRRQGVGTYLNPRPLYVDSGLEVLESIESLLANRGLRPQMVDRRLRVEPALPKAAARLDIPEGTPLTVLSGTVVVDGRPVAYLLEVTPTAYLSLDRAQRAPGSLLDWMLSRPQEFDLDHGVAHITPVHGSPEMVRALAVAPDTPLFFMEQTVHEMARGARYYARNYYVPSFFDFHVIRRRAPRPQEPTKG